MSNNNHLSREELMACLELAEATIAALRLERSKQRVDSIFDVDAIRAEAKEVQGILDGINYKMPKWSDRDMEIFAGYCCVRARQNKYSPFQILQQFKNDRNENY